MKWRPLLNRVFGQIYVTKRKYCIDVSLNFHINQRSRLTLLHLIMALSAVLAMGLLTTWLLRVGESQFRLTSAITFESTETPRTLSTQQDATPDTSGYTVHTNLHDNILLCHGRMCTCPPQCTYQYFMPGTRYRIYQIRSMCAKYSNFYFE